MWDRIPEIFFGFEFQKDQLENVGAVGGGRIFGLPIDLAHRLHKSLMLCSSRDTCMSVAGLPVHIGTNQCEQ